MDPAHRLRVWHDSRDLAARADKLVAKLGARGSTGAVAELKLAANAVTSHLSTGAAQRSRRRFARDLERAIVRLSDVERLACRTADLGLLTITDGLGLAYDARRLQRMVVRLHRRVEDGGPRA